MKEEEEDNDVRSGWWCRRFRRRSSGSRRCAAPAFCGFPAVKGRGRRAGATAVEVGFGRSGGRRGGKGGGGAIAPVVYGGKGKEKGERRWFRPEKMEEGGGAFYERFRVVDMVGENGEVLWVVSTLAGSYGGLVVWCCSGGGDFLPAGMGTTDGEGGLRAEGVCLVKMEREK
ncbi:hypothetical protein HAX54_034213 [Datura stramonium]|uniref:Uncharacterized protein n=1 Tax=Datura stramonium TaxID=4076 RepID=A0ABS8VFW5_DATST|nr:hypothetical protein [Datura stramonium]